MWKESAGVFRVSGFGEILPTPSPESYHYHKRYEQYVQRRENHVHHRTLSRAKTQQNQRLTMIITPI